MMPQSAAFDVQHAVVAESEYGVVRAWDCWGDRAEAEGDSSAAGEERGAECACLVWEGCFGVVAHGVIEMLVRDGGYMQWVHQVAV